MNNIKIYIKIILITLIIALPSIILVDRIAGSVLNNFHQGWNHKGYRGPVKEKRENVNHRIIVLGGSVAAGYGLNYKESFPYILEKKLSKNNFDVVNLGKNGQGIYGILNDVKNYYYLNYDIAIIHNGYNDCTSKNFNLISRNENFFYRKFNYLPILYTYISDKIRRELNIKKKKSTNNLFNSNNNLIFNTCQFLFYKNHPDIYFDKVKFKDHLDSFYLIHYKKVLNFLEKKNKKVIMIIQPKYGNDPMQQIQSDLLIKLSKDFNNIKVLNLSDQVDITDINISYDALHYTKYGNELIVKKILPLINK